MRKRTEKKQHKNRDRIGVILYVLYLIMLVGAGLIIGKLIYLQTGFKPDPKIKAALTPQSTKIVTQPERGDIYDCKGRLLAMSCPNYILHMDCTVQKSNYEHMKDREKGARLESEWRAKARDLSVELAKLFPEKKAKDYYNMIIQGREKGSKYLAIGEPVDRKTRNRILEFPLWREGAYKGGLIIENDNIRVYPYGKLARRTIGFIRSNKSGVSNTHIGLEGHYDALLHGKEGIEWQRLTDNGKVRDFDSTYCVVVDGQDLHTTLDIDYQEIADRALRIGIEGEADVEGGCLVMMEVKTGDIKVMVNLTRDKTSGGSFEEISNMSIGRKAEPGSVFKTVTLMTLLEDGKIKSLDQTIPTNHGIVQNAKIPRDMHIVDYEAKEHTNRISVLRGFEMSSNYVFATLALTYYQDDPERFLSFIDRYHLNETPDFDLDGWRKPTIPSPKTRYWTNADLAAIGYGYTTEETPLHILMYYNAIANRGMMMKPHLVGDPVEMGRICSEEVALTLNRALKGVTQEGTAKVLSDARAMVAGKTGTSFATFENGRYQDEHGRRKYQGTFAGYFPADDPQYSVICTIYSKPTNKSFQGGGIPARAIKALVDQMYNIDPYWQTSIKK